MTIPSTGTTWRAGGFNDVDSRFSIRGGLAAVLIRDNRGADTNISPYVAGTPLPTRNWTPFADDGTLRDDLFASIRVDGDWITNPETNEGFWLIGAMSEDGGPERAPNTNNDNQNDFAEQRPVRQCEDRRGHRGQLHRGGDVEAVDEAAPDGPSIV